MDEKNKTKKESFYLSDKNIADVYYRKDDNSVVPYLRQFTKRYKELVLFFGVYPPKVRLRFIYTRAEMNKHWGGKTEKWLCGMVDPKSIYIIYIFSPLVFEKLTTHKKDEIISTVIHETAHTFVSQINKKCFAWVNEGVCQFLENNKQ